MVLLLFFFSFFFFFFSPFFFLVVVAEDLGSLACSSPGLFSAPSESGSQLRLPFSSDELPVPQLRLCPQAAALRGEGRASRIDGRLGPHVKLAL